MNQQTIDMLTEMKMTAMAAEFANQIQDASFNSIGFEERLSMLVTAEWNRRQNNKVARLMRNAEFGIPSAVMEEIEYHEGGVTASGQVSKPIRSLCWPRC